MPRTALFLVALASLIVAGADTPSAQCVAFSKTVSCAPVARPGVRFDSGTTTSVLTSGSVVGTHALLEPAGIPSTAIDCAMVQPVDPTFHSAIPIVRPEAGKTFSMKIVKVPSCKSK